MGAAEDYLRCYQISLEGILAELLMLSCQLIRWVLKDKPRYFICSLMHIFATWYPDFEFLCLLNRPITACVVALRTAARWNVGPRLFSPCLR